MIVFEDTTEPFSAVNRAALIDRTARFLDQLVVEPLVIALQVVVLRIFLDGLAKVTLAQWDDLPQTLGFDGKNKPYIVLLRDPPPIPPKQGVRRQQGADLEKPFPTAKSLRDAALAGSARRDRLGLRCETAALTIGKQQALSTQLLAEYPVLLLQVLDDILLTAIHPSREDQHQKLELQSVHELEDRPIRVPEVSRGRRPPALPDARDPSPSASAEFPHSTPVALIHVRFGGFSGDGRAAYKLSPPLG
jgi:hypothetical protein